MDIDIARVEDVAKELYIRALKILPARHQGGLRAPRPRARPTRGGKRVLGTMIRNIAVAEETDNLLCQDTGIPIYNVTHRPQRARRRRRRSRRRSRRGCERATREHPLRSSVVHPITRKNRAHVDAAGACR